MYDDESTSYQCYYDEKYFSSIYRKRTVTQNISHRNIMNYCHFAGSQCCCGQKKFICLNV